MDEWKSTHSSCYMSQVMRYSVPTDCDFLGENYLITNLLSCHFASTQVTRYECILSLFHIQQVILKVCLYVLDFLGLHCENWKI